MTLLETIERARRAWERSQPQLQLDVLDETPGDTPLLAGRLIEHTLLTVPGAGPWSDPYGTSIPSVRPRPQGIRVPAEHHDDGRGVPGPRPVIRRGTPADPAGLRAGVPRKGA